LQTVTLGKTFSIANQSLNLPIKVLFKYSTQPDSEIYTTLKLYKVSGQLGKKDFFPLITYFSNLSSVELRNVSFYNLKTKWNIEILFDEFKHSQTSVNDHL
jgi:hypothetical protein